MVGIRFNCHGTLLTFSTFCLNIVLAKKSDCVPMVHRRTPRELQLSGGSIFLLKRNNLGWPLILISIQPFANIVADYTCRNRDKKSDYVFQKYSSFLLERVNSILSIAIKKQNVYWFKNFDVVVSSPQCGRVAHQ